MPTADDLRFILPTVVSLASLAISISTFSISHRKDRYTQTFSFLNEWRSKDYTDDRDYIFGDLKKRLTDDVVCQGFGGLSTEDVRRVRRVTNLLDYAGTAMLLGHVDKKLLIVEIGDPIRRLWEVLGGLIYAERERRRQWKKESPTTGPDYDVVYQAGFEHIAECARTFPADGGLHYKQYRAPSRTG
jgi:hypothetical protein